MKKIYLLLALTAGLVSCDMDKEPYDSVPDTDGKLSLYRLHNFKHYFR